MWALHLILIIPSAMAAFIARSNYLMMYRHAQLSEYPYHTDTVLGFYMAYIGVCAVLLHSDERRFETLYM